MFDNILSLQVCVIIFYPLQHVSVSSLGDAGYKCIFSPGNDFPTWVRLTRKPFRSTFLSSPSPQIRCVFRHISELPRRRWRKLRMLRTYCGVPEGDACGKLRTL